MLPRTNSQFLAASVTEFISVWAIGGDASLTLTTNGGFTTIAFNCTIGHPGSHHSTPAPSAPSFPPPPPRRPRHRGPKEIERNRQRAARHQAAKTAASVTASEASRVTSSPATTAPVVPPTVLTLPASEIVIEKQSIPTESVDDTLSTVNTLSPLDFECDQCEYANKSENGLSQHKRMKHRISQVDGFIDSDEELPEETSQKLTPSNEDFYTLEVTCAKDVHSLWCCDIKNPSLNQNCPPVPAPPKVFHPNLGVFGYLSTEVSTPSCSTYLFEKDNQDILSECFKL